MGGRFIVLVGSVGELKVSSKKVMVLEPVDVGLKFWVKGCVRVRESVKRPTHAGRLLWGPSPQAV